MLGKTPSRMEISGGIESQRRRPSIGWLLRYVGSAAKTINRVTGSLAPPPGNAPTSVNTPSTRSRISQPSLRGCKCKSLAPASMAAASSKFTASME